MKSWCKALALAAIGASFVCAPSGVSAQTTAEQVQEGLCRRPSAPVDLPPEPAEARVDPASRERAAGAPTSPSPESSEEDEAIVVTGTRLERRDFTATSPVTALSEAESADAEPTPTPVPAAVEAEDDRGSAFRHRERRQPSPEAGLLTAGDHDDLLNPELYANYVDAFLAHETLPGVPRVDTRRALTIAVEDRAGRAVPFAEVTLTCGDGNRLTLSTSADGTAVFFPELDRLGARVTVSVRHDGRATRTTESVSLSRRVRALRQTITVDSSAAPIRSFDLALVVDTTGSMSDELEYLKAELDAILARLRQSHPDLDMRVALVSYRDIGDVYVTRTYAFTDDVAAMQADLARQRAGGGGDYPEAVEQAMARAVALDWRPGAVRSILFVADAPPHADDVVSAWRSAEAARGRRIQIVPVGASGIGPGAEYMMRAMAAVTQSRYIFLTDDSGIGNTHAPPAVDCYLVTSLKTLIERVLDQQISGERVEPGEHEVIRAVGNYDNGRCRRPPL